MLSPNSLSFRDSWFMTWYRNTYDQTIYGLILVALTLLNKFQFMPSWLGGLVHCPYFKSKVFLHAHVRYKTIQVLLSTNLSFFWFYI